jgi:hypothetical protein
MQHCNMFQTHIFMKNFNKVLMQCSHSKHVNIIQTWGYNCNKTKLVCIDANIFQNFFKCSKNGKHELHAIVYAKETYVRYACYLLTSRDTFLNLFSLDTMSCFHQYVLVVVTTLITC